MNDAELLDIASTVKGRMSFPYRERTEDVRAILKKYGSFDRYSDSKKMRILNKMLPDLCNLMGLNAKFVNLEIAAYYLGNIDYAAAYDQNSSIGCTITLCYHPDRTLEQYVAILLHELGHFFEQTHGIDFDEEYELCTDIMLVYMGFSEIMKRGYSKHISMELGAFDTLSVLSIGYISTEQIDILTYKFSTESY